ncbi:MAG: hypothetical protein KIH67_002725 [Candidatus Moranbacteria bacterium]|nr:hypothetical protein [Candidatus Moranbacteria bacterium]
MQEERKALEKRLKEIQATSLEGLSDEAVLELLAERKHVENTLLEYIKAEKEAEAKQSSLIQEEHEVEEKIDHLNKEIGPDKKDEELLALIQERHQLEEELFKIHQELKEPLPAAKELSHKKEEAPVLSEVVSEKQVKEALPKEAQKPEPINEKIEISEEDDSKKKLFKEDTFGSEEIRFDNLKESGEFEKYVHQLESSRESLGSFMQTLPREARSNKGFMLRVATIDPAYAMHYALEGLRRDKGFHVQIASMKNNRNSGNAVAEMDQDMRTGEVVLAATRQDFRNVHYVTEDMPEYDDIIAVAKKGALEKIGQLKEAVSLDVIVPKILRSDEEFMKKVKEVLVNKGS